MKMDMTVKCKIKTETDQFNVREPAVTCSTIYLFVGTHKKFSGQFPTKNS